MKSSKDGKSTDRQSGRGSRPETGSPRQQHGTVVVRSTRPRSADDEGAVGGIDSLKLSSSPKRQKTEKDIKSAPDSPSPPRITRSSVRQASSEQSAGPSLPRITRSSVREASPRQSAGPSPPRITRSSVRQSASLSPPDSTRSSVRQAGPGQSDGPSPPRINIVGEARPRQQDGSSMRKLEVDLRGVSKTASELAVSGERVSDGWRREMHSPGKGNKSQATDPRTSMSVEGEGQSSEVDGTLESGDQAIVPEDVSLGTEGEGQSSEVDGTVESQDQGSVQFEQPPGTTMSETDTPTPGGASASNGHEK